MFFLGGRDRVVPNFPELACIRYNLLQRYKLLLVIVCCLLHSFEASIPDVRHEGLDPRPGVLVRSAPSVSVELLVGEDADQIDQPGLELGDGGFPRSNLVPFRRYQSVSLMRPTSALTDWYALFTRVKFTALRISFSKNLPTLVLSSPWTTSGIP